MFSLLTGELYKWKRSKSFWACATGAIIMALVVYLVFALAVDIQNGEIENGTGGVTITETTEGVLETIGILDVMKEITSGFSVMFLGIFVCIWVIADFNNGAIKNVVGKGYSRGKVFLSKYLSTVILIMIMNVVIFTGIVLLGIGFIGTKGIDAGFIKNLFTYIVIQLLLEVAFTSIIVTVCEIARNTAIGISISMVIVMFSSMLSGGLDMLFKRFNLNISATKYWVMDVIAECPVETIDMEFVGRVLVVTIVWALLAFGIGMLHFKKVDIK